MERLRGERKQIKRRGESVKRERRENRERREGDFCAAVLLCVSVQS